jgi:hypothetical protein
MNKKFTYPGYMSKEAQDFFKDNSFEEPHPNVEGVSGTFVYLSDGTTHLPSKGETFVKDEHGKIKLVIPQEEPKQYPKTFKELFANTGIEPTVDEEGNKHYAFKATLKQTPVEETLEKAAANLADPNSCKTDNWIAGAKWSAKQLYSEEDIRKAFIAGLHFIATDLEDYETNADAYIVFLKQSKQ